MLIAGAVAVPGDAAALDRLMERVYGVLHAMAAQQMKGEAAGHTLGATALANEAYLRLRNRGTGFTDRGHFFAAAAQAMRAILIDHARRRDAAKRGGKDLQRCPLDDHLEATGHAPDRLLAIDEALEAIERADQGRPGRGERGGRLVEVARMSVFAQMTAEQIGLALGTSARTVERDLEFLTVLMKRRYGI